MKIFASLTIIAALSIAAWPSTGRADDKTDSLTLMERYPAFVQAVKTTDLRDQSATLRLTLCRATHGHCESFLGDARDAEAIADYVYLCAVFDNDCRHGAHAASKGSNAQALIQEAHDKGFGETLLNAYGKKYACDQAKDRTGCILHKLYVAARVQRSIAEYSGHTLTYVNAGQDGEGDPFGE